MTAVFFSLWRAVLVVLLALAAVPGRAEVRLPALFSDHMVLQRSEGTALWGTAAPGEKVAATLDGVHGETSADGDGRWRLRLDLSRTGPGPFVLEIQGENRIVVSDVAVGEVWLVSGQSNMAFRMEWEAHFAGEKAAPDPAVRQFRVGPAPADAPRTDVAGKWVVAAPGTLADFSAVGYFFAKEVRRGTGATVGLINASVGGTVAEAWTSLEALHGNPELGPGADRRLRLAAEADRARASYSRDLAAWLVRSGRADRAAADPAPFSPEAIPPDAVPAGLPGKLADAGLPDAGAVWLWKRVVLSPGDLGREAAINLGAPEGFVSAWWNGKPLGATALSADPGHGAARAFYVTPDRTDNLLAVRLYAPFGQAGIPDGTGWFTAGSQSLKGEWRAKAEYAFPARDDGAGPFPAPPPSDEPRNRPGWLSNGMIDPLIPFTLRGVAWYQGENSAGRGYQYRTALPVLIADWRRRWGADFPFYFCQLPVYGAKTPLPSDGNWADLRESQTKALAVPGTGEVVLIDQGEAGEIHYRDKREAGRRLALLALAKTYGRAVACSGPVFRSSRVEGDAIRVAFDTGGSPLAARPLPEGYRPRSASGETLPLVRPSPESALQGFAVCGADRQWKWAAATIDGETVVVRSAAVPHPVAVRYAWADDPTCNLFNEAGLPAAPFRTDDFPLPTQNARF